MDRWTYYRTHPDHPTPLPVSKWTAEALSFTDSIIYGQESMTHVAMWLTCQGEQLEGSRWTDPEDTWRFTLHSRESATVTILADGGPLKDVDVALTEDEAERLAQRLAGLWDSIEEENERDERTRRGQAKIAALRAKQLTDRRSELELTITKVAKAAAVPLERARYSETHSQSLDEDTYQRLCITMGIPEPQRIPNEHGAPHGINPTPRRKNRPDAAPLA